MIIKNLKDYCDENVFNFIVEFENLNDLKTIKEWCGYNIPVKNLAITDLYQAAQLLKLVISVSEDRDANNLRDLLAGKKENIKMNLIG